METSNIGRVFPEVTFMNGCAVHPDGRELLVCESRSSRILSIDLQQPDKWSVWLEDDLIGPGASRYPAANGIKVRGGFAYITVSARYLIVRAPIRADGSAGSVETVWRDLIGDDFAFGSPDHFTSRHIRRIRSFASTHPANGQR
jgi:hypothetical protein